MPVCAFHTRMVLSSLADAILLASGLNATPLTRSLCPVIVSRSLVLEACAFLGLNVYLKRLHLERTGERTLFSILPAIRSTNDIDLFLRAEVLSDLSDA